MSATAPTRVGALVACLALCLATGAVGAWLTAAGVRDWYPALRKPSWTPPDWVFGPVWTLLYLMMGVAAWLVYRRAGVRGARWGLGLFLIQLALNAAWSGLFFALRNPALALVDIVALWAAIGGTIVLFARTSPTAAGLMVPYFLWVSFATALNWAIWSMNP